MRGWIRVAIMLVLIYGNALKDTLARNWSPTYCDGKEVAEVKRGAYFAMDAPPGRHTLLLKNVSGMCSREPG